MTPHRPLEGIRVIEFGTGYVGPLLCQLLGDFGADVIKVETHRRLDFMRGGDPDKVDRMYTFFDVNRNKRSVLLDVRHPEGYELAIQLVRRSDVLVENLSAGAMQRLKLDYETVRQHRPDLVMISLQGFGANELHSTTFGQNIPPFIGLTYLWNHPTATQPVGSQLFHPDYFAGLQGACAVMAALDHRRRTGVGQYIDAPQTALAASLLGPYYLQWTINREVAKPVGNRGAGAPQGCYRCRGDDAWVVLAVEDDEQWHALKQVLGEPTWAEDVRFASLIGRQRYAEEIDAQLAAWIHELTPAEVVKRLRSAGIPSGEVQDVRAMLQDPHLHDLGFFVRVQHPKMGDVLQGSPPAHLSRTPADIRRPAPLLGQHTREVMMEVLGLSEGEIECLMGEKVFA